MSLVGSLEDLGLGEILQIVSLSGKSGVLWIRSREGEGRIVFLRGLIRGAFVKDGPRDLHQLVAAAGAVPEDLLASLSREAGSEGTPLEALLCARTPLDAARIDQLRERHVESTVLRMFGWPTGEFSFEIRDQPADGEAEELLLRGGLNAQFVALEGARLRDEGGPHGPGPVLSPEELSLGDEPEAEFELVDEVDAEGEAENAAPALEVEGPVELQITVLELVDGEVGGDELPSVLAEVEAEAGEPIVDDEPTLTGPGEREGAARGSAGDVAEDTRPDARAPAGGSVDFGVTAPSRRAPPRAEPALLRTAAPIPVVAVDRELAALEWVKRALAQLPARVHIFQRSEQAIARIRQYVARAELPLVVLTTSTPADPVSGARDWSEIAARLRAQVPSLPLVLLAAHNTPISPANERAIPDAISPRPDLTVLSDDRARERRETLATELRGAFERARARVQPRAGAPPREDLTDSLRSLREISSRLRDPASRGEVLRLVMDFAGRSFDRVAVFGVRDGEVQGVAQIGLPLAGGPDDEDLRRIRFPADEPGWFRKVLASRAPLRAAPDEDGDRDLVARLGRSAPAEAYVAPIESGDRIAAVLYADNLTTRRPLPDTSAFEVVLHEAGLALERGVREPALEQAESARAASEPG